jgi:hypothetical protein
MFKMMLELFRKPNAKEVAQRELDEAQRELLAYHTRVEYDKAMVGYLETKIKRLQGYVRTK